MSSLSSGANPGDVRGFGHSQGPQELNWLCKPAPKVWILSRLAQNQKKKKKKQQQLEKEQMYFYFPLSIISLTLSGKPKKSMF